MSGKSRFDPTVKLFYRHLFIKIGLWTEAEREVFSHSRRIDMVVVCKDNQKKQLENTVFKHFEEINALEFKGHNDDLNVNDFNKIQMRYWALACYEFKKLKHEPSRLPSKKTVTIICHTRPTNILDRLSHEYHFEKTERNGIYHSKVLLNTYIIHPTKLDVIEENYPLLPLARGETLEKFLSICEQKKYVEYIELAVHLGLLDEPDTILGRLDEEKDMNTLYSQATMQKVKDMADRRPDIYEAFSKIFAKKKLEEGIEKEKKRTAMKMKKEGLDVDLIAKITGLSFKELQV